MVRITFLQKHLKYHNEGAVLKCYYDKKYVPFYLVASMAIPVGKWVGFVRFSASVEFLPVTSPVSGVFVHRAFCAYLLRIVRVVEMRRFRWWTQ